MQVNQIAFFFDAPNVPLHPPHYSNTHSLMTTGSSCDYNISFSWTVGWWFGI